MSTLEAVKAANASFKPSYTPVALFVGGTSGIGQGLAEAFARHTKGNAHILIVGRNRDAAEAIIAQFPKPTDSAKYTHEFVQCDVTLMRNVETCAKDLLKRYPKINFLFMSPGIMTMKGRDETEEGIDRKLAVHYYARWKFINDLAPALVKAEEAGEDAKVLSVLAAGHGGEIDLNDLGLKKNFSLRNAALSAPTYNDLMLQVGLHVEESGEYMLHAALSNQKGFFRAGSRGEDIGMSRYFGSDEARKKLWEHTVVATTI
ncbi:hypothetical protein H0H93_001681 [Arthromyces matolae]|nr:hypothetical protein H0H93_001681 [Arthromyces matolae]